MPDSSRMIQYVAWLESYCIGFCLYYRPIVVLVAHVDSFKGLMDLLLKLKVARLLVVRSEAEKRSLETTG